MISWKMLMTYCIFSFFAEQQRLCYRDLQGASQAYYFLLGCLTLLTMAFTGGFLIFYGFRTTWYWPVMLFVVGLLFHAMLSKFNFVRSKDAALTWSILGFLAIPTCVILLIHFTP
jgi:hypothetical protein